MAEDQEDQEDQEDSPESTDDIPTTDTADSRLSDDQVSSLKESITKDLSGQVSQQVSESVIQKIGKALGLTEEEKEELPKDAESLQKLIDNKVDAKLQEVQSQYQQQETQTAEQREEKIKSIVSNWNQQYKLLADTGKVPPIKDPTDQKDPGVQARRQIILHIGKMIDNLKQQGTNYTPSISDALIAEPDLLKDVPGADLPISGNTSSRENADSFLYDEIAGKSFEQIAQGE